jgi:hypothetical protein
MFDREGEENNMYKVRMATPQDRTQVFDFLVKRGLLENAWLAWYFDNAFKAQEHSEWDQVWSPFICCSAESILGAAFITHYRRSSDYKGRHDYQAILDAVNAPVLCALAERLPDEELGDFFLHQPFAQGFFDSLPNAKRSGGDPYFTITPQQFRPVSGESLSLLTAADQCLFEGCEQQFDWEHRNEGSKVLAILREGRVASSLSTSPLPPADLPGPRVAGIGALHTEIPYRRQGLARRLVSYTTELVLKEGHLPMYNTEPDNIASQNLARSLGYWQYARRFSYEWRKPKGWGR